MTNNRGYTYLITNGREYKIGITTKTPQSRVAELQTGSPTKIAISAYSYNSNALAMEVELHKKFSSKRLEGEWFALNSDDVAIIHHHFENNHLDEYRAPLSAKGIEVNRKAEEKERKKANAQRIRNLELAEQRKKERLEIGELEEIKKLTTILSSITQRHNIAVVGGISNGTELYPTRTEIIRKRIAEENKILTVELLERLIDEKERKAKSGLKRIHM